MRDGYGGLMMDGVKSLASFHFPPRQVPWKLLLPRSDPGKKLSEVPAAGTPHSKVL